MPPPVPTTARRRVRAAPLKCSDEVTSLGRPGQPTVRRQFALQQDRVRRGEARDQRRWDRQSRPADHELAAVPVAEGAEPAPTRRAQRSSRRRSGPASSGTSRTLADGQRDVRHRQVQVGDGRPEDERPRTTFAFWAILGIRSRHSVPSSLCDRAILRWPSVWRVKWPAAPD